ncbi:DUF4837 family protein [Rhodohalobacter halophilus]|uniref:DUF4837 family protein n=1 Tax=Rhodohalobacter halophilus TaxID=1812810 RepID=UPI00083FB0A5|nr:DUF4837 family protein [Rhodohalobacter halophilus]
MKNRFYLLPVILVLLIMNACESDYRPMSIGQIDEVFVVMDSTKWDSETALAIEETFGKAIETLPSYEPTYRLIFRDFRNNDELDRLRELKNIIFAAPIDEESNVASFIRAVLSDEVEERVRSGESFAFPLEDRWVRDQWALILTSNDDTELSEKIRNSEESLVGHLMDREFDRRIDEVYRRGEQVALSDSLWENHGWRMRIQHDYVKTIDTTNVQVYRRSLPDNDRWILAWWKDDVPTADFLDYDWINSTRDSLLQKYVQGTREGSYVTTEYRDPRVVTTKEMELDNRLTGFETLGTWRMTNDFMGGPFVNFFYHDPETERLFMLEYGQFAPSVGKRRFVRQFRAMGRTFESDSTWTNPN